jgi:hypothetical protein
MTCERISFVKSREKSFSTPTPVYNNYRYCDATKGIAGAFIRAEAGSET